MYGQMALLAFEKAPFSAIFDTEVRAEVEAYRRGNLDEAIGRMSRRAAWATDQIAKLAEGARSESVRLAALRSMLESGNLLIHPRCSRLKDAFGTYGRQRRGGEWIDYPADSHPEEDSIDALRGGVRDAFPEGLVPRPNLQQVHAARIVG